MRKINVNWYKRFLSNAYWGESESDTFNRLYRDWGMDEICLTYSITPQAFHAKRRKLGLPIISNHKPRQKFNYLQSLQDAIAKYGLAKLIEMNERRKRSYVPVYADYEDPWTLEE